MKELSAGAVLAVIPMMILLGCASVAVHKLNANGRIDADDPEGLRFYRPRPYVAVTEPFVIETSVYLAAGEMSPDGSFILLTQVPTELASDIAVNSDLKSGGQKTMGPISIDASKVLVSTPSQASGPQGASASGGSSPKPGPTTPTPAPTTSPTPTSTPADGSSGSTPGIVETKVANDNEAFAVTPLPRFFTIVWLPDWEEQYVITTKSGLGSANTTINFLQGWSLQGLDAKVDNSAIVKPLLDFYSGTLGALQKVATAKIEGPLSLVTGKPQGASAKTRAPIAKGEFGGGTSVTVKITKARMVAPGLYKILKPTELAKIPSGVTKNILKPVEPLTDIPFNTYDVIVMEATRASGDSAFTLGQYSETTSKSAVNTPPANAGTQPPAPTVDPNSAAKKKLDGVLSQPDNMTTAGVYYISAFSNDPKTGDVNVALSTTNGGKGGKRDQLQSEADIIALVIKTMAPGLTVYPKNVTVKH